MNYKKKIKPVPSFLSIFDSERALPPKPDSVVLELPDDSQIEDILGIEPKVEVVKDLDIGSLEVEEEEDW